MPGMNRKLRPVMTAAIFTVIMGTLLFAGAGCSRTMVTEEFFQAYRVRQGTVLEIYNPNGPVSVEGSDQDKVEIAVLKETYQGQEALDRVDLHIDIADTMVIETIHPDDATNVTVSYDIKVPEGVLVSIIDCSNGNIEVQGVAGNPVLTTSNGNIIASEVDGVVSARSSNGDLVVSAIKGLASLRTSNGDIEAELQGLAEDLEIMTSNGSIKLSINPELALDLEANTSNGEISFSNLDLETTLLEQAALAGIMNGGGHMLNIATSNGSIELGQLQ